MPTPLQKAKDAARYGVGVCLTPIAVLGVASIALAVFVADKFEGLTKGAAAEDRAAGSAEAAPVSAA